MTICPICEENLSTLAGECPGCGAVISDEMRRLQDAEYLAQDKWAFADESGSGAQSTGPEGAETEPAQGGEPLIAGASTNRGYKLAVLKGSPDENGQHEGAGAPEDRISPSTASGSFETESEAPGSGLWTGLRANPLDDARAFATWLGICAALLIALWAVPEVVGVSVVFPFQLVKTTHGVELVALLAGPMAGALLLAILVGPFPTRKKAAAGLPVCLFALVWPLGFNAQLLLLQGRVVLLVAIFAVAAAVASARLLDRWLAGHLVLVLLPAALLVSVLWGAVTGQHPWGHVAPFKDPVELYAAMLATALCAGYLYGARED